MPNLRHSIDRVGSYRHKSKKERFNITTEIVIPILLGLVMMFSSLVWQNEAGNSNFQKYFPG
jgi:hypothetical protein